MHLQGGIKADEAERKTAKTARERLSDLPRKGICAVYGRILSHAVFDLAIVDDIRNERPHDEIKKRKTEKADDIDDDIDPNGAGTHKIKQEARHCTAKTAEDTDLAFAESPRERNGDRRDRKPGEHTYGAHERGAVLAFEIVDKEILADGLSEKLRRQDRDRGYDDADERTAFDEHFCGIQDTCARLFRGGDGNALLGQKITNEITNDGEYGKDACGDREARSLDELIAVFIRGINEKRNENAHDDIGKDRADASENGKGSATVCVFCERRCHRAVGDIDGGIKNTAPKKIGREHIRDAQSHRCACHGALIHEKAYKRNGNGDYADPRTEFSVLFGVGAVDDAAHRDIRERIEKTRHEKKHADKL